MIIGFIGTGTITSSVVTGLFRHAPDTKIEVSRRSEVVSSALQASFPQVVVRDLPSQIVASADVIVLCVRPAQLEDALAGIEVSPGKTVISFVSGLSLAELQARFPGCAVARVVPLPAIARHQGPILATPLLPVVQELFAPLGDLIGFDSEAEMLALSPLSAFMSTYFTLQNSLIDYAAGRGVREADASLYVRSLLTSVASTGLQTHDSVRADLPVQHETPGGLNERVRRYLVSIGWFDQPRAVMDELGGLRRDQLKASGD